MLLVDTGSGVEVVYSCPQMFDRGGKPSAECSSGSEVQGMWQEFQETRGFEERRESERICAVQPV